VSISLVNAELVGYQKCVFKIQIYSPHPPAHLSSS